MLGGALLLLMAGCSTWLREEMERTIIMRFGQVMARTIIIIQENRHHPRAFVIRTARVEKGKFPVPQNLELEILPLLQISPSANLVWSGSWRGLMRASACMLLCMPPSSWGERGQAGGGTL